mgnify:CR=1 FL=1
MRNITISLDDDTAAWARRLAAERDTSVSRLVAELLAEKRRSGEAYRAASPEAAFQARRSVSDAGRDP